MANTEVEGLKRLVNLSIASEKEFKEALEEAKANGLDINDEVTRTMIDLEDGYYQGNATENLDKLEMLENLYHDYILSGTIYKFLTMDSSFSKAIISEVYDDVEIKPSQDIRLDYKAKLGEFIDNRYYISIQENERLGDWFEDIEDGIATGSEFELEVLDLLNGERFKYTVNADKLDEWNNNDYKVEPIIEL